jgi:hypothetical protein
MVGKHRNIAKIQDVQMKKDVLVRCRPDNEVKTEIPYTLPYAMLEALSTK